MDLKPCPLCGSGFKMGQEPQDSPYVGGMFYLYHDYGPMGSAARQCPIEVPRHFASKEAAIAAWNRRAPDDEAAALAAMQPHERQNFHRVMGQRAVVKRIAEKQIREGE